MTEKSNQKNSKISLEELLLQKESTSQSGQNSNVSTKNTVTSKPIEKKTPHPRNDIKTDHQKEGPVTSSSERKTTQRHKTMIQVDSDGNRMSMAESAIKTLNKNGAVDNAIGTVYQAVKSTIVSEENAERKTKKKRHEKKYRKGYTQNIVPVKSILNGIITTTSGKYIKILEILPINFSDMTVMERKDIAFAFGQIFHNGPAKVHLKSITDKSNPSRIIEFIKEKCEEEKWQRGVSDNLVDCAQDVINKVINICNDSALTKRFFFIYQYEGKSTNPSEIFFEMDSIKYSIINQFASMGNIVIDNGTEKASYDAGEILYYYFNRTTCREEPFLSRITRINNDFEIYNANQSVKAKDLYDVEYLAPKGIYFTNSNYMYMDGSYKTFLMLKSTGHPSWAEPGWLENFMSIGDGTELDIYIERMPHDFTQESLEQMNRHNRVHFKEKKNNPEKQEDIFGKITNIDTITKAMNNDEDLFYVCIIITLSSETIRGLRMLKSLVMKQLNREKRYVEPAYANCKEFYLATLPLMEMPSSLMKRNRRNYLTSSLESLYMYTSFEFYDPNGFVIGVQRNNSLVSLNPFNTNFFNNANMSILGQTGAGKTFSMEILARAMRICAIRVFMILPLKAHEYFRGTMAIDGSYIQFGPGMKDRYNICEITPEQNIDKTVLAENIHIETSLLSKKISFLITWIQLNRVNEPIDADEADLLEIELTKMYADFGITNDNDSIWLDKEKKILKDMPIIGDMYDRFMEVPQLNKSARCIRRYVSGNCSNMNGPTNIDLTGKFFCIDVDQQNMEKNLLAPFIFVATELIYSLVKENRLYYDMIFMDEIWNILANSMAAERIREMVKIIRGYGGGVVPTTQDINDYMSSDAGKAILAGTAIKVIMHLEPTEARLVAKELGLTEEDAKTIIKFKRGEAMILTNAGKVKVNIIPSEKELYDFTTDPVLLRKYAMKDQKGDMPIK